MTTLPQISFGEDVRKPALLQRRDTREVLFGIRDGAWQETVASVRSLPNDSQEQNAAKARLPYCTWAGVFSYRANANLVRHSGQCGIDLDGLGDAGAVEVIQKAVADAHCLAAYRSTRGEGVRLIFRIPPCSPESHTAAFEQVASHVQRIYARAVEPLRAELRRLRIGDRTPLLARMFAAPVSSALTVACGSIRPLKPCRLNCGMTHNDIQQLIIVVCHHRMQVTWP